MKVLKTHDKISRIDLILNGILNISVFKRLGIEYIEY